MTAAQDTPVSLRLRSIKHIIIVCSGKGGVGKSSVSTQLALSLRASSSTARVGILDVDLTGPSIPRMLGLDGHPVHQSSDGWVPVYADGSEARLACMSVGFLLKRKDDSVVWRGPKKNAMIRQFLSDVRWGELDYLVIDTPPGESRPAHLVPPCPRSHCSPAAAFCLFLACGCCFVAPLHLHNALPYPSRSRRASLCLPSRSRELR